MKYFCIGIKGSGMSTLACLLADLGHSVSGYDDNKEEKFTLKGLRKRNIKIYHELPKLDESYIITASKAIASDHPIIKKILAANLKIQAYNEIIGNITKDFKTIAVCGTHGKTTISYMLKDVLEKLGVNYFVGDGSAYGSKNNKYFILEADEYNKHFLAYHKKIAIVSNIEADHLECYKGGLKEIIASYNQFIEDAEIVIACFDDPNVRNLNFKNEVISYGLNHGDFQARNLIFNAEGAFFDLYHKNNLLQKINLKLYGEHLILNALAAIACALHFDLELSAIIDKLNNFKGANRRFKIYNLKNEIVIDDYAHHPTEISATLNAIRAKYPSHKVSICFIPNTYSRMIDLYKEFITALNKADQVFITDVYSDREKAIDYPNFKLNDFISSINNATYIDIKNLSKIKNDNDIIAFMSCASIENYVKDYIKNKA